MTIHQTIKNQMIEALRAKNTIKLNTLRGLLALFTNEMLAQRTPSKSEFLPDEKVLILIKRSANQRQDSIRQFEIGKRPDLADKERAELAILQSFLPTMMSRKEIRDIVMKKIKELKVLDRNNAGASSSVGRITGMIMKEFSGQANGNDVKAVVEEILK